ncbi:MAG: hypothetical protein ACTTI4_06630, partial [Prevotella fusca]|uniref:hypothetical protein n=1 Tax=Prevotella fusca TaxID=589436 RepID=UPI003F9F39C7
VRDFARKNISRDVLLLQLHITFVGTQNNMLSIPLGYMNLYLPDYQTNKTRKLSCHIKVVATFYKELI